MRNYFHMCLEDFWRFQAMPYQYLSGGPWYFRIMCLNKPFLHISQMLSCVQARQKWWPHDLLEIPRMLCKPILSYLCLTTILSCWKNSFFIRVHGVHKWVQNEHKADRPPSQWWNHYHSAHQLIESWGSWHHRIFATPKPHCQPETTRKLTYQEQFICC